MNTDDIRRYVEDAYEDIRNIRRTLHMNPELSCQEFETQKLIIDFLEKEGIEYVKIADTGVMGMVHGQPGGNTVAMRADIDALPVLEKTDVPHRSKNPGKMHACGHDMHTAINLGCARFFSRNRDAFCGTMKFFFQPAEESSGGAKRMIEQGCMDNPAVDYVIGLHVTPSMPYNCIEIKHGTVNASTDSFKMKVIGLSGHGAYPDLCTDAIVIAAYIVTAMQTLISRSVSPLDSAVVTIGKIHGGTANNIISGEVEIEGTIRSGSLDIRKKLFQKIPLIASNTAEAMGGKCETRIIEGYIPLVNHSEIVEVVEEAAAEILGTENIRHKEKPSMGGEDFSFFVQHTKGAFYNIGCKHPERTDNYSLHNDLFDVDERSLKTGMAVEINSALKLLAMNK